MIKNNNFHFLRFLFALLVVISHSYPLSGSNESAQWIYQITYGQIVWASIGLNGFFIISGYFIFQSHERSKSIFDYYRKRFLRLFPALFVVLLLSVLLAPFVYKGAVPFFENRAVYTYLPNNLILYNFQSSIKGIFDTNAYHAINGSLWTIRYEFSLYVAISFMFFFRKKIYIVRSLLFLAFAILYIGYNFFIERLAGSKIFGMNGYSILNFGAFFVCGSLLASFRIEQLKNKGLIFLVAILFFVISVYFNFYNATKHLSLPIIILMIGFIPLPFFSTFGKYGDSSYGIYIYSFPVQQTLMYFFKLDTFALLFSSVFISIIFGYLSWHFIEKEALKYKNGLIIKQKVILQLN